MAEVVATDGAAAGASDPRPRDLVHPAGHVGRRGGSPRIDVALFQRGGGIFLWAGPGLTRAESSGAAHAGAEVAGCGHDRRPPPGRFGRWAATSRTRPDLGSCTATAAGLCVDAVPSLLSRQSFAALGSINTVAVGDASALPDAVAIVTQTLREIDEVCSRFRPDSELSLLNRCAGQAVTLSALLEEAITAALDAAAMTDGLVDPTAGARVIDLGYESTFRDVPEDGPAVDLSIVAVAGWQSLDHDAGAHTLRLPVGASIDLGASGKAWADRAADRVAKALGIGVLVDCGGDVAVRGRAPDGGWPVRVAERLDGPGEDIAIFEGGLATSGVTARRWRRGGVDLHHIIDPATGLPARTRWSMASVAAATCLEANAAATAALIMDGGAPRWLDRHRLPARLVGADGAVRYAGGWCA